MPARAPPPRPTPASWPSGPSIAPPPPPPLRPAAGGERAARGAAAAAVGAGGCGVSVDGGRLCGSQVTHCCGDARRPAWRPASCAYFLGAAFAACPPAPPLPCSCWASPVDGHAWKAASWFAGAAGMPWRRASGAVTGGGPPLCLHAGRWPAWRPTPSASRPMAWCATASRATQVGLHPPPSTGR